MPAVAAATSAETDAFTHSLQGLLEASAQVCALKVPPVAAAAAVRCHLHTRVEETCASALILLEVIGDTAAARAAAATPAAARAAAAAHAADDGCGRRAAHLQIRRRISRKSAPELPWLPSAAAAADGGGRAAQPPSPGSSRSRYSYSYLEGRGSY